MDSVKLDVRVWFLGELYSLLERIPSQSFRLVLYPIMKDSGGLLMSCVGRERVSVKLKVNTESHLWVS